MGQLNLYHDKARFYPPALGRFLKTDLSGFAVAEANMRAGKLGDAAVSGLYSINDFVAGGYDRSFASAVNSGNDGQSTPSLAPCDQSPISPP